MSGEQTFVPRYYAIEQSLRSRIAELEPDAPLPSDAQLCEEFAVSRMTARNAVQRLVQEGLVYRLPGRGTFVADYGTHRHASTLTNFTKGWPLLVERRTILDQHGVPLETTETRYAAGRYAIDVEFVVEQPG